MKTCIDEHGCAHGVEPIRKELPIVPSTYRRHAARRANPASTSARAQRDAVLADHVRRAFQENCEVYGALKVWWQLRREGFTLERLMRRL